MAVQLGLAWSLLVLLAIVGIYDVYAVFVTGPQTTVSAVIQEWAHNFPPLGLLLGFILGHLFWQNKT